MIAESDFAGLPRFVRAGMNSLESTPSSLAISCTLTVAMLIVPLPRFSIAAEGYVGGLTHSGKLINDFEVAVT